MKFGMPNLNLRTSISMYIATIYSTNSKLTGFFHPCFIYIVKQFDHLQHNSLKTDGNFEIVLNMFLGTSKHRNLISQF